MANLVQSAAWQRRLFKASYL